MGNYDIRIVGFVVTKKNERNYCMGIPIYRFDSIRFMDTDIIIISMKNYYEVEEKLKKKNINYLIYTK